MPADDPNSSEVVHGDEANGEPGTTPAHYRGRTALEPRCRPREGVARARARGLPSAGPAAVDQWSQVLCRARRARPDRRGPGRTSRTAGSHPGPRPTWQHQSQRGWAISAYEERMSRAQQGAADRDPFAPLVISSAGRILAKELHEIASMPARTRAMQMPDGACQPKDTQTDQRAQSRPAGPTGTRRRRATGRRDRRHRPVPVPDLPAFGPTRPLRSSQPEVPPVAVLPDTRRPGIGQRLALELHIQPCHEQPQVTARCGRECSKNVLQSVPRIDRVTARALMPGPIQRPTRPPKEAFIRGDRLGHRAWTQPRALQPLDGGRCSLADASDLAEFP